MALATVCFLALQGTLAPTYYQESGTIPAPTPNAAPRFGTSLAYENGRMLVGAPHDSSHGLLAGVVHVYEAANGFANPVQTLYASDAKAYDEFGTRVALSGDTLAVTNHDVYGTYGGYLRQVYVFERQGGTWVETQILDKTGTGYGSTIALEGDTLLLGDPEYSSAAVTQSGRMHLYERGPSGWSLSTTITAQALLTWGHFGTSPVLDGDRFAVGCGGLSGSPRVYIFDRTGPTWSETHSIPYPFGAAGFGSSIALDGDRVAAGAAWANVGSATFAGKVFVYAFDGLTWNLEATLLHPAPASHDNFGGAIALEGSTLLVSSAGDAPGGSVQVFREQAGTWTWTDSFRPGDAEAADRFGTAMALDGTSVAVGNPNDTLISTLGSGSVRLFDALEHETYCTAGSSAAGCSALISAAGSASASAASGFSVTASGVEGSRSGYFFFGTSGRQANPWGQSSSYQCVVPPVKRAGLSPKQGTPGQCDGSHAVDLNAVWSTAPNKNPGPGVLLQAQFWYRDPNSTSNQTTSLSDALETFVQP